MTKPHRVLAKLLLLALAVAPAVAAQDETPAVVTSQNRSGDLPFSTSIGAGAESVDAVSGNLMIRIPIASVKGRGLDYDFTVRYDSGFWAAGTRFQAGTGNYQVWNIEKRNYLPDNTSGLGWEPNQPFVTWIKRVQKPCNTGGPVQAMVYSNYIYHDALGGKHPLGAQLGTDCYGNAAVSNGPDFGFQGIWVSSLVGTYPTIRLSNGTQLTRLGTIPCDIYNGCGAIYPGYTSSNGNQETEAAAGLDTLGRAIVTQQNGTNQILYKVYDSNGALQTYTLNYSSVSLATAFNVIGLYGTLVREYTGSRNMLSSIVLPNGRSYVFHYEPGTYGGLTRIDFPTGAYVTYTWGTFSNGYLSYRYVTSRTLNVNGNAYTWNILRQCSAPCTGVTSTVTDPLGNVSVYTSVSGEVTNAKIYNGAAIGNPLRQYAIDYGYNSDPTGSDSGGLPIRITTTLDDGRVSKKEFDYDLYTIAYTDTSDFWNFLTGNYSISRGNVTEIREFDLGAVPGTYGSGTPGPLLRRTDKTYLHNSNANYITYNIVDHVSQETIYDGSGVQQAQTQYEYDNYLAGDNPMQTTANAAQHDYANFPSTFIYRGNATRMKRWRNTDSAFLTTTYEYDDLGNIRFIKDPLGHTTTFDYTDSFANSFCLPPAGKNGQAWVSTVTNPLSQLIKVGRYPCTALVQAHKDQNDINASRAGTTYTYDLLGRTTAKNLPDGGQISFSYNDVPPVSTTITTKITSTLNLVSAAVADGLGRTIQSQLTSDPQGTDFADTTYDALGRVATVSNPYRSTSDPTYGVTTNQYDALARPTLTIPPDGTVSANHVATAYLGACVTITDEAAKSRKSCTDGLGRLAQVFEDPAGLNYETNYQYDVLDNLIRVDQKGGDPNSANWRTRLFTYNSLSQLLSALNPESGTTFYSYTADGTLAAKVGPAPNQTGSGTVTICFGTWNGASCDGAGYDALHRLTKKSYSNGDPTITYTYDQTNCLGLAACSNFGGRTGMTDAAGSEAWAFDAVGRPLKDQRTTNSITKNILYAYNLNGSLATLTYPSGRVLTYTLQSAGANTSARFLSSADLSNSINYATAAAYAPQGALASITNGGTLVGTFFYNSRLQPCRLSSKNSGTAPTSCSDVVNVGNILDLQYDFALGASDNGNVMKITNNRATTRSANYTYDSLNRVAAAYSDGSLWGETYQVDAWSNLNKILAYAGKPQPENLNQLAGANNRFTGMSYDAAGNLLNDGLTNYSYNAENQIANINAGSVTYTYDGDGKRVTKSNGKLYWYGTGSGPIAETDLSGNLAAEYIFFGGKRIARLDLPSAAVHYYFSDHLGSASIVTSNTGTIQDESDYYPFGGERIVTNSDPNTYKFTGKERDPESGLDDFGSRFFSSMITRFMAVDPVIATPERMFDPQQLNRYAYVRNNPLRFIDPTGEILRLFGDLAADKASLCSFAGLEDCNRITIDDKTGVVSFDTQGLNLSQNEGALLLSQLVGSSYTYAFGIATTENTAGGPVDMNGKQGLESNLDNKPDSRYAKGKSPKDLPPKGIDDQVTLNPNRQYEDSQGRIVPQSNMAFHELAEAYSKIDGGNAYGEYYVLGIVNSTTIQIGPPQDGAHENAVQRENKLRDQRPSLQSTGRAGDHLQLIRDPHN